MKIQKCITCNFPLGKKRTREGMYVSDSKLLLDSKYLLIILLGWHAVKNINTLKKNPIISYCANKRRSALSLCKYTFCSLSDHVDYDTNS